MTERTTRTPSGLYVVEHVPDPPPAPPKPDRRRYCVRCGELGPELPAIGWQVGPGWNLHRPCCGHEYYVTCDGCQGHHPGCPVCLCDEEYT